MALTDMAGLQNALEKVYTIQTFMKNSMTSKGAGYWQSLWRATGSPLDGAIPGNVKGVQLTNAAKGAFSFINPVDPEKTYLSQLDVIASIACTLVLYDRILMTDTLSGIVTTAQTINSNALIRHTDGVGVEAWLEVYTATGSTAVTATLAYTDPDDTSRTATAQLTASAAAGHMIPFQLQSSGIKSAQTLTLSATTGTAGNFGITLLKRKATLPIPIPGKRETLDMLSTGLANLEADACVAMMMLCTGTTAGSVGGSAAIVRI